MSLGTTLNDLTPRRESKVVPLNDQNIPNLLQVSVHRQQLGLSSPHHSSQHLSALKCSTIITKETATITAGCCNVWFL